MKDLFDIDVVYSDRFGDILQERFRDGWTLHLLCRKGAASFTFNGSRYTLRKNDCCVISHTALIGAIEARKGLEVEIIFAPLSLLRNLLPANNYGIGGSISLFHEPVMHLDSEDAARLHQDIRQICRRLPDKDIHPFYMELMGSLLQTMMYDLFAFHAKTHGENGNTERTAFIVKRFLRLLEAGHCRTHRSLIYYAAQLNVSPKYLSDTVKRMTGFSVTHLIDRYTLPILNSFLEDDRLSLTQISDEMNFSSNSYFTRYCTKHLGMTPGSYRNRGKTK